MLLGAPGEATNLSRLSLHDRGSAGPNSETTFWLSPPGISPAAWGELGGIPDVGNGNKMPKEKRRASKHHFVTAKAQCSELGDGKKSLSIVYLEDFVDKIYISKSYNYKHFNNLKIIRSKIYTDKLL